MHGKKIFVTVGTTKFDKLIETLSSKDILKLLKSLGYNSIQFQIGRDSNFKKLYDSDVELNYCSYFENFEEQIHQADLVISHGGAGSCLDILKKEKPLIVVINDDLMDNHQVELAEELQKHEYLYYCSCNTLKETLMKDFSKLKKYPISQNNIFSSYLDKCVGFV